MSRRVTVFKQVLLSLVIGAATLFCEGSDRPIGPSGPQTPGGPAAARVTRSTPAVTFWQLDVIFDDGRHHNSAWGKVGLEYVGTEPVLYFNLTVGGAADGEKVTHEGVPNQEAGDFECAPVAASNSLQWLKKQHKLAINDADISIDAMKQATDWKASRPGVGDDWPDLKDAYLTGKAIPVTTTRIDRFGMDEALAAMKRKCDVELTTLRRFGNRLIGHVVAITAITAMQKLADGTFAMTLTHDADQGKKGGTEGKEGNEEVKFDPAKVTGFSGAPWINNRAPQDLVVECPTSPS